MKSWGGIWGRALTEKKTFLSNHAFHVPQGHIQLDRALVVPIMHQDNVIGEIAVANKATDYGDEDRQLVEAAVSFIAPILSARLERDIEEKARKEAEEALREQARRDPLTGALNHGAIVNELARLVARGFRAPRLSWR